MGVFTQNPCRRRTAAPRCSCLLSSCSLEPLNHNYVIFCSSPFTVITCDWQLPVRWIDPRYAEGRRSSGSVNGGTGRGSGWWKVADTLSMWQWKSVIHCRCWDCVRRPWWRLLVLESKHKGSKYKSVCVLYVSVFVRGRGPHMDVDASLIPI